MMLPVAILAGGLATRMRPYTNTIPKALLLVNGKPFVDHQLQLLAKKGVKKVVFCIGYLGEQLRDHIKDGSQYGLTITWSTDGSEPLGTGGALRKAVPLLGDQCMVLYGDSYLDISYQDVCDTFCNSSQQALMTIYKNENNFDTSNVHYHNGTIIHYTKKHPTPAMRYIDYGLGCFNNTLIEQWPEKTFELAELYSLLAERQQLLGYEVTKRFYEIGSPNGLKELEHYLSHS